MSLKKCECIILRGDKFKETKKVVTFFSLEYGKMKGVASGVGKMKSSHGSALEVITHSSMVFYENPKSELGRINQCDIINSFSKIKGNLDKLQPAIYITELVRESIPENIPAPDIFKLFMFFLRLIDESDKPPTDSMLRIFEVRLVKMLGILPDFETCAICGIKPHTIVNVFDPVESGILCERCQRGGSVTKISRGGISFIRSAENMPINKIKSLILGKKQGREVREVLHMIIVSFINKELNSFKFLYNDALLLRK